MNDFKGRHFTGEVILWAVRWYCRYGISYRDLEEMLSERGIDVDHTTIYRWVQRYAPEMEKRLRWFWRRGFDPSWRLDETYVKVRGKWTYLYRAVDKRGDAARPCPMFATEPLIDHPRPVRWPAIPRAPALGNSVRMMINVYSQSRYFPGAALFNILIGRSYDQA